VDVGGGDEEDAIGTGAAGEYAGCARADLLRGLPQSRQYRAAGSFSCPQKEQNTFAGAGVGVGEGVGGGAATG
jgi:hypothetical protein